MYQSATCGDSEILQAIGIPNNACLQTSTTNWALYSYPNTTLYHNANCASPPILTVTEPTTCATNMDDDDTFQYNTYQKTVLEYGPSDDDSNSLSAGAIAGIVIGSVVGAGLIIGLIAYFTCLGKKSVAN